MEIKLTQPTRGNARRGLLMQVNVMLLMLVGVVAADAQQPSLLPPPSSSRAPSASEVESPAESAAKKSDETFGTICIGTPRHRVRELLGKPTFESHIPSLRRLRECYADGTEVTFVEGKAISVIPGERAQCTADGSYVIELDATTVQVAKAALRQCGEFIPDEEYKCSLEEDYWFAPTPFIPTAYNGLRFTPPAVTGPYIRGYLLAPHFFWRPYGGHKWCPECACWH